MSPGYLSFSLGMDYKPSEVFSLFLSPVSSKFTFVPDEDLSAAGSFGLDPGQTARAEMGAYIKMAFKKEILLKQRCSLKSCLALGLPTFSSLNYSAI